MLYDPKWNEIKPASLDGFIAWLEQQDQQGQYAYRPCETCAIGEYLKSIGTNYRDHVCGSEAGFYQASSWNKKITHPRPWTFGAALDRARALSKG